MIENNSGDNDDPDIDNNIDYEKIDNLLDDIFGSTNDNDSTFLNGVG